MLLFNLLSKNKLDLSKNALIFVKGNYNYKSLFTRIEAESKSLGKIGVKENNRVALLCDNSPEFIFSVLALWKLKAVPVPVNNRLLIQEIKEQISFAGCEFLIYDEIYKNLISEIDIRKIKTGERGQIFTAGAGDIQPDIEPSQTALILFTSGSTGISKAVEISFNNLVKSAETGDQLFRHSEKDVWLAALPFYHVGGFSIITRAFLYGATLALPAGTGHKYILESLKKFNPTLTAFVTTQLKRLLDDNVAPNPNLRHILLGGGFMDPDLVKKALESRWNVSKSYGATETSSFVTALTKEEFEFKPGSAGKTLYPNKILIVDENRRPLPAEKLGEVVVESESVARGYLNNKSETNKRFSHNHFYTGDYGYLDVDGYLYIEARRSDLIISGGENVNPNEVERIILKHPDVADVFVYGSEDKEWGHIICAALVTKGNKPLTINELKNFIKDKLPSYKHPKKLFLLESFPKTALGKIQKEMLKNILAGINQAE